MGAPCPLGMPDAQVVLGLCEALQGNLSIPAHSLLPVPGPRLIPGRTDNTQVVLGPGVILLGGQSIQTNGFRIVLQYAAALIVQHAQVVLCACVTLIRRHTIPGDRFFNFLRHPAARLIHEAQVVLGARVAPDRCLEVPPRGFRGALGNAQAA